MTVENNSPVNADAQLEAKIKNEAERIITATCEKHGVKRDALKPEYIQNAHDVARTKVTEEVARQNDPVFQQLLAEREQNRLLQLQLQAVKTSRTSTGSEVVNVTQADHVRQRLGNATWFQMTLDQRLAAIGVEPSSVTSTTKQEIKDLFGKGASSQRATDYVKTNKTRYLQLREIGRVLDLIGR